MCACVAQSTRCPGSPGHTAIRSTKTRSACVYRLRRNTEMAEPDCDRGGHRRPSGTYMIRPDLPAHCQAGRRRSSSAGQDRRSATALRRIARAGQCGAAVGPAMPEGCLKRTGASLHARLQAPPARPRNRPRWVAPRRRATLRAGYCRRGFCPQKQRQRPTSEIGYKVNLNSPADRHRRPAAADEVPARPSKTPPRRRSAG